MKEAMAAVLFFTAVFAGGGGFSLGFCQVWTRSRPAMLRTWPALARRGGGSSRAVDCAAQCAPPLPSPLPSFRRLQAGFKPAMMIEWNDDALKVRCSCACARRRPQMHAPICKLHKLNTPPLNTPPLPPDQRCSTTRPSSKGPSSRATSAASSASRRCATRAV